MTEIPPSHGKWKLIFDSIGILLMFKWNYISSKVVVSWESQI